MLVIIVMMQLLIMDGNLQIIDCIYILISAAGHMFWQFPIEWLFISIFVNVTSTVGFTGAKVYLKNVKVITTNNHYF